MCVCDCRFVGLWLPLCMNILKLLNNSIMRYMRKKEGQIDELASLLVIETTFRLILPR